MKILHVADNFNAVTGHFVNVVPKMLKRKGHEVEVYSSTAIFNKIKPGDKNYPCKIRRFNGKIFFNRINIFPGLIPNLLFKKNPDVIHGYVYGHFSAFILGYLKKIKGYKLVVEADFNVSEPEPSLLKSIYIYFFRKIPAKGTDIITTFTSEQREELSKRWGIDKRKIKVLPIGLDYKKFASKPKRNLKKKLGLQNKFVILNVSRLNPQKNIEMILKVIQKIDDKNVVFVHIGAIADKKYKEKLDSLVNELKIKDKVKFLGPVYDEDLSKYYKIGDVFLQTSHKESFGISLIEAMASGLPILTVKEGVAVDVIKEGKTGFMVSNEEEIFRKINKLLKNRKLINDIGKNAKKKAKEYDWKNIVDGLEEIYKEVVK